MPRNFTGFGHTRQTKNHPDELPVTNHPLRESEEIKSRELNPHNPNSKLKSQVPEHPDDLANVLPSGVVFDQPRERHLRVNQEQHALSLEQGGQCTRGGYWREELEVAI